MALHGSRISFHARPGNVRFRRLKEAMPGRTGRESQRTGSVQPAPGELKTQCAAAAEQREAVKKRAQ